LWIGQKFVVQSQRAIAQRAFGLLKAQRRLVQVGTLHALLGSSYCLEDGTVVTMDKQRLMYAMNNTRLHKFKPDEADEKGLVVCLEVV
jgi:hypothetical protein